MHKKNAAGYHTCDAASKNASSGLSGQTRAGVSAVINLLMINPPCLLAHWLENLQVEKYLKGSPKFRELKYACFLSFTMST